MPEFDLDLQAVESQLEGDEGADHRVILDILDGTTPDEEWVRCITNGAILVLNVDGDVNEQAGGFARDVRDSGGSLVHFRGFLIVTPPSVEIDTDRLE
ncbi:DUF5779 family protein [Halorhabdus salina]|uniref:DUF5779 family protein n=1 Tax=Halorhabdus salina TaxID=2750670 RepID=UPI0015EF7E4A|nr:DUF5779 family protein [Halorhabdus salina]